MEVAFRKTARFEELGADMDALDFGVEAGRAPVRDVCEERVEFEYADSLEP